MSFNTLPHSIKSELKDTVSLSVPLVASQIIYASSGFVGTAMVAKLGEDALAASVLVSMVWMSLSVLFFGILNSVSVLTAHQYGAKNNKGISDIMGQAFLLGILTIFVMTLILCSMPFFMRFSAQPPMVVKLSYEYMFALLWTIPGLVMLVIMEQFLAGINRARIVLRISLLVVPIEIPIIYMLIFGKFGLPACGVAGIGYGFAVTYTGTAIAMTFYLLKSPQYRDMHIFSGMKKLNIPYLKELIVVGLPMGFMYVIEVSTFAVMTFWIAQFGTTLLAAHQIVMQYLNFAITLVFAMAQAVTVRVGHSIGRQDLTGVRYAVYVGMLLNFILVVIIALAFLFYPDIFLRLDMDIYQASNAALRKDAAMLLGICSALLLFDNFRIIGFGALRGLKDTRFAMFASLISFWLVGLSAGYLFGFYFHLQGKGIWWGIVFGIASGAVIVFLRLQYLLKHADVHRIASISGVD